MKQPFRGETRAHLDVVGEGLVLQVDKAGVDGLSWREVEPPRQHQVAGLKTMISI